MTLKLAPLIVALKVRHLGAAWYNPKDHSIYLGFAPPRYILEILSHETLHQVISEHISHRASGGIDAILDLYGNILRRGGL